jgi:hypothetical protein
LEEASRKAETLAAAAATGDKIVDAWEEAMEGANGVGASECERKPLSEVVGDCVQRWFQDAFKEARKGDVANQVLVAQMFFSGYGVPKNEYKVPAIHFLSTRFISTQLPCLVCLVRWGFDSAYSSLVSPSIAVYFPCSNSLKTRWYRTGFVGLS